MERFLSGLTRNGVALCLSLVLMVGLVSVSTAQAEMISSQDMEANNNAEAQKAENLDTIDSALDKEVVQERLEELGYTAKEIQHRLDRLSPEQAQDLAERIDNLETGGDIGGWSNSDLLGVLLIVLIVVLII